MTDDYPMIPTKIPLINGNVSDGKTRNSFPKVPDEHEDEVMYVTRQTHSV